MTLGIVACSAAPMESGPGTTGHAANTTGEGSASRDTSTSTVAVDDDSGGADDGALAPDVASTTPTGRVRVVAGATKDAELVEELEVARSEDDARREVVLRLGPEALPDLLVGDRLSALAEVQVTTRCDVGQNAPGCGYNPEVGARVVLRGADGSATTLASQTERCTKAEHHCMFVFDPHAATIVVDDTLACVVAGDCAIEVELWAWHADARAGGADRVLVGENEGNYLDNGEVKGDKARLMAVRERDLAGDDRFDDETTADGDVPVPTDASSVIVYSHPLVDVRAGEQFVLDAEIVTAVSSRARVSSKMYVTHDAADTEGASMDGIAPTMVGEHNGTNCTTGTSPCTTRKVAVFEATDDLGDVFVNVVIRGAVPGGGAAQVTVDRTQGRLRSTRYDASLGG